MSKDKTVAYDVRNTADGERGEAGQPAPRVGASRRCRSVPPVPLGATAACSVQGCSSFLGQEGASSTSGACLLGSALTSNFGSSARIHMQKLQELSLQLTSLQSKCNHLGLLHCALFPSLYPSPKPLAFQRCAHSIMTNSCMWT